MTKLRKECLKLPFLGVDWMFRFISMSM